ncbi:MAG: branched-chain amino acid ABC transporter permease [Fimbriimonadaceae bacterium]|nr:MAG: branched-chain amino acid ABC transporter permease [Fimbriimonadaceae bacterium]
MATTPAIINSIVSPNPYRPVPFWTARLASVAALVAFLYAFHTFVTPKMGIYDVRLFVLALLFSTLAVSLNLINGITGQFSIGHAAFYLIGAITSGKVTVLFMERSGIPQVPWMVLMLVVGAVAAAIAGLLVGLPSLRLRGDYLAVATLGFGEIVNVMLRNQDGGGTSFTLTFVVGLVLLVAALAGYVWVVRKALPAREGPVGRLLFLVKLAGGGLVCWLVTLLMQSSLSSRLDTVGRLDLGGAYGLQNIPKTTELWMIFLLLIGTLAVSRNLLKHAHGLGFLAVREDELAADATGVNTTRIKVTAFVIGAAIAGMAGALFAHYNGSVAPDDFKMDTSFILVAMVVIGGTGSITGSALAGISLKMLEEGLRELTNIPAIVLIALVTSAALVFIGYQQSSKRKLLKIDGKIRPFLTVLGLAGCAGLVYLGYLFYHFNLSWVIKSGGFALMIAIFVGVLLTPARKTALPRFGLLGGSLALVVLLTPWIAKGLHQIGPLEKLIGETTYTPSDLRWAVFSIALVFVMILRPQGTMGHHEFSWAFVRSLLFGQGREKGS